MLLVLWRGGIFSWLWFSTKAVVSIDVNPSVALSLNRFEYVIDTQAGNTDGAEVLDDLSLKNLKLSTALEPLMGAMSRKGYLDDQAQISVFVDGSDDDFNRELYDEITEDLAHLAPDAVTQVGESATAQPDTQQPPEQQTTEQTTEQPSAEQTTEQPATDQTTEQPITGQTGEQQPQQSASITEEQAKEIAANHAGVAVADLTFHSVSLEEDDGRAVYDVEFYSGSTEYDYEIDAATGDILSYDNDVENFSIPQQQGTATGSYIGEDAAKAAALQRGRAHRGSGPLGKVRAGRGRRPLLYELEFSSGQHEYECEVEAFTGEILNFEQINVPKAKQGRSVMDRPCLFFIAEGVFSPATKEPIKCKLLLPRCSTRLRVPEGGVFAPSLIKASWLPFCTICPRSKTMISSQKRQEDRRLADVDE